MDGKFLHANKPENLDSLTEVFPSAPPERAPIFRGRTSASSCSCRDLVRLLGGFWAKSLDIGCRNGIVTNGGFAQNEVVVTEVVCGKSVTGKKFFSISLVF